jgi:hypothetical protein
MVGDPENHIVAVVLSTEWDIKPTALNVKRSALHECLELFFMRLGLYAISRNTTDTQITEETHRLIRCLENRIYPKDGEPRKERLL